jgi:hypothetical protein
MMTKLFYGTASFPHEICLPVSHLTIRSCQISRQEQLQSSTGELGSPT